MPRRRFPGQPAPPGESPLVWMLQPRSLCFRSIQAYENPERLHRLGAMVATSLPDDRQRTGAWI